MTNHGSTTDFEDIEVFRLAQTFVLHESQME